MKNLILFLYLAAVSTNANNWFEIYGGTVVSKDDPVSRTTVRLSGITNCTGTLISSDLVLTAGHCIGDVMSVDFGLDVSHFYSVEIIKSIRHENFRQEGLTTPDKNDIGLVQFSGGLPTGFEVASLPENDFEFRHGDLIETVGFGTADSSRGGVQSGVMRRANEVIDMPLYGENEFSTAPNKTSGVCVGDSGGPYIKRGLGKITVVGLVSRGKSAENCNKGGIHTRVDKYLPWIKQKISELH